MRILFAVILIFAVLCVAVIGAFKLLPRSTPPLVFGMLIAVSLLALVRLTGRILSPGARPSSLFDRKTGKERLRELQEKGLLVSTDFKARRAFAVDESEDEGPHYFLELEDGTVLYLNGQYLYDYGLIEDDPEVNQPMQLPCSEFTLRRHRTGGHVCDIQCRGRVLAPEITFPPFRKADFRNGLVPEDGDIIRECSYDDLKARIRNRKEGAPC